MPLKKIAKFSLVAATVAVCALGAAYYYFFKVYMPNHFQKEVLPALMKDAGITGFTGTVRSAGPSGANLGELCVGDPQHPALKVRSVIIKYRFRNIFMPRKPEITSLELHGLELVCRMEGKRFEINNIDVSKFIEQLKKHFTGKHKQAIGSWSGAKLRITGGLMHLNWNDTRLLLPFEMSFNPRKQNWQLFHADVKFSWRDHPIKAELTADLEKQTSEIKFSARADMRKVLSLIGKSRHFDFSELQMNGLFDIEGEVRFGFSPWKIQKMKVSGSSGNSETRYGDISIYNKQRPSGLKEPLAIGFIISDGNYVWELKNAMVKKPFAVFAREFSCRMARTGKDMLNFAGEFEFDFSNLKLADYYNLKNIGKIEVVRKVNGRFNRKTGNWQLKTADSGKYSRESSIKSLFTWNDTKVFSDIAELEFSGRGCRRNGNIAIKMYLKELSGTGYKSAFFCNDASFRSVFRLIPASEGKIRIRNNRFKLSIPEFMCTSLDRRIKINDFAVNGSNSFNGFKMNGFELTASAETMELKQNSGLLLLGENSRLSVDGVFQKKNNSWEVAVTSGSDEINGSYKNSDFSLKNMQSKNYVSLQAPLLKWGGARNCSLRLKCDSGEYNTDDGCLKLFGLNLGTAIIFDREGRVAEKTCSGAADNIQGKYRDSDIVVSSLELGGKFKREGKVDEKKPDMNFIFNAGAAGISLNRDKINYAGQMLRFKIAGRNFDDLKPEFLKTGIILPDMQIMRGNDKIKITDASLEAASGFIEGYGVDEWKRSLKNINLSMAFGKTSGIWDGVNISCAETGLKLETESECRDDGLYLKKLNAELNAEKALAYGKTWKLASRKAVLKSKGSGPANLNINLKPDLRLKGFYVASRDVSMNIPAISVRAELREKRLSGKVVYDKATFGKSDRQLICRNISMRLPFGDNSPEGKLTVGKVELRKRDFGRINAKLKVRDDLVEIGASHFSKVFSGAGVFFRGRVKLSDFPQWEGDFTIPEFKVRDALNVGVMFPNLGAAFVGRTAVEGSLKGDLDSCRGSGVISIKKGILNFAKWELAGINGKCDFTDLFKLESAPRQKLSCTQAGNGSVELADMQLEFQMRGRKNVDIERLSARWYGGLLTSLKPFALEGNNSKPEKVNFLAEDIVLSMLLENLGVKGFAADAFVGGMVALKMNGGKVFIADASLGTRTGKRGFLRLNDNWNKYIEAGAGEAEINRKKFAAAALGNFNYNWIRLNASETEKASRIELNIDGYPAKAVPFKYNSRQSSFEPTASDEPGLNVDMTIETKFVIPRTEGASK